MRGEDDLVTTLNPTEQRRPSSIRLWAVGVVVGLLGAVSAGLSLLMAFLDFSTRLDFPEEDTNTDLCGLPLTGFWSFWESSSALVEAGLGLAILLGICAAAFALVSGRRLMAGIALTTILVLAPIPWVIQADRAGDQIEDCHQL